MGQIIKIKRGNKSSIPPNLEDGELFLAKDKNKLIIKNGENIIEFVNDADLNSLSLQLNSLADSLGTISENVSNLNNEIDLKLTSPPGNKGQILGYLEDNIISAIDINSGASIITSIEPPENLKTNDLWLQIL